MSARRLLRTTSLVTEWIPKDLANIVISFVCARELTLHDVANAGEYETCLHSTMNGDKDVVDIIFQVACRNGYEDIVRLMISRGPRHLNAGLRLACILGHTTIIKLLVSNGADCLSDGIFYGCMYNRMDVVHLMIDLGANPIGHLNVVCESGNIELVEYFVSKGADDWDDGLRGASRCGSIELVELMISKGATNLNMGCMIACENGYKDLAKLLIRYGADYCSGCSKSIEEHL